jgi:GDP-4-dehydro-6-deoxy-D-mannose reductase
MRALITGISGFVGGALADHLISTGWEVSGFDLHGVNRNQPTFTGSILDKPLMSNALKTSKPDVIFHLAGAIKARFSKEYFETNVLGTLSLFESLLELDIKPRVIIASTSAVYGSGLGKRPISETFPLHPVTDYAASKASQELVARRFYLAYGIPVIITRTFNLIGPGQPTELACSAFARQIALDENLQAPDPIRTGNLSAKRDFLDVRDAVKSYAVLARQGTPGAIYNVCSGRAVSLQTCLDLLLGLASKPLVTELDQTKIQHNDIPIQVGNAGLIRRTFGWQPKIPLQQSLQDLLNDWRVRVKSSLE